MKNVVNPLHWLLAIVLFGVALPVHSQGTQVDYGRALGLAKRFENKVFRDRIRPRWLEDNRHFWYRVEADSSSHEFILVDAEHGTRDPAVDAERLAAALRVAGVADAKAAQLPLARLEFDLEARTLTFCADGRWWNWQLDEGRLDAIEDRPSDSVPRGPMPRASRRTGPESSVTFINRTELEVELLWLDTEGRRCSYGLLAPGQRRTQHTFAGHAWLVVATTSGRILLGFEASEDPLTLDILDPEDTSTATRQPREADEGGRGRPREQRSPDGQWSVFLQEHNLWLRNVQDGQETALSTDGTSEAPYRRRVYWSPDSSHVAGMLVMHGDRRQVNLVESTPDDQLQPKLHTFEYAKPGDEVEVEQPRLFAITEDGPVPVTVSKDSAPNPYDLRWAPDSTQFTFIYNQRGHQVVRLVAVEASTGETRIIVNEECETFFDYAHKLFVHYLDDTGEIVWMSERDGWNHLYLIDTGSGQVKNSITGGEWVVRGVEYVDAERRQVWFRAGGIISDQDPYQIHLGRVDFDGSNLVVLTEGDGHHQVQFSPDRRYFVDTWSRVDHAPVIELRRGEDGKRIAVLEQTGLEALVRAGWRPPERFVAKGRDGVTDIYGIIHRPLNFDPRRKYPVIEQVYAGPQGAHVPKEFRAYHKPQTMAELGFIVVQIDGMGTSYRSKAFHDVCWRDLGDAGFPDRIRWIQDAAEHEPAMDLTRVGIYGGSAGGQNAMRALIAHGDFYHVAVADCGCHDNRMDKIWWNELYMGWPVGSHYEECSNAVQAHRLQGKLLLIVGELDRNVDPASTMQVVSALVKADKDFDLLVLPGTGHGAAETVYGNRRRMDYFVRHLLGVEPRNR
jgi:dipeptidyl aminopeptidase/acylaminoacyl peptidase